jgi:hypothetical protein
MTALVGCYFGTWSVAIRQAEPNSFALGFMRVKQGY